MYHTECFKLNDVITFLYSWASEAFIMSVTDSVAFSLQEENVQTDAIENTRHATDNYSEWPKHILMEAAGM